jgi:outer membrane receptor for ferrienterochelin and colicins
MANTFHTHTTIIRYTCVPLLLLSGSVAYGQTTLPDKNNTLYDLPLDQLVNVEVVSASRFKQKSSEAPSAVEVVTAQDIRSFGWRTLADALNAMRGLYIRNDRNYSYLGTRGFSRTGDYNSRVLIMVDGRRMNDSSFDQGFIGEEFILDMNLIDRIEYIPGTGSSVYGANALLGVINVITKQSKQLKGLRISGEVGSLDTYRGRASFGKQWRNGADLLINASQYYSQGEEQLYFPEFATTHNGIAQNMDLEKTSRLFGQLNYQDLTLRAGYADRYKRVPTGSFGAIFNDKTYFTNDRQLYVDLDYNTQINTHLGLQARAFHHWFDYHSVAPYDGTPHDNYLNYDASDGRWWGGEIKLTGTQFAHHKWLAGLNLQYDQRQYLTNYDIDPYQLYNASNRHGWRTGVYAQDEWRITDSLLVNIGLRLDQHHMINNLQLHPRIGIIWDITPALTTKLLYGSAFRAPNVFERDYHSPPFRVKNPTNTEELVYSYEAVTEWRPGNGLKLLATVFYNDMHHVLTHDATSGKFVNTDNYQSYGFEAGAEKHWDNGRRFKLTWTHTHVHDADFKGGGWSPDSPNNLVKLHYAEPFFNQALSLGFEEIFVDQRRTLADNIAPAYHLLNINLAAKTFYGFQPSLGFYNVLNQHYQVVGGSQNSQDTLTMDGRTVRFRLEYNF